MSQIEYQHSAEGLLKTYLGSRTGERVLAGGGTLFGGDAMCFLFSLIPATLWVVLGYFVLFSSTKTQGALQKIGRILAFWVFIIAAFIPVMGAYVTFAGLCPIEAMMQSMHSGVSS